MGRARLRGAVKLRLCLVAASNLRVYFVDVAPLADMPVPLLWIMSGYGCAVSMSFLPLQAHHRHTAPPVPKPAPPPLTPPPTSSPLSVTSLELRFACWQLQPPALRQQMEPAVPRTAVPNADVAAAAAAPVAPQPSPSAAPRIRAPRPLLAAFVVVSVSQGAESMAETVQ